MLVVAMLLCPSTSWTTLVSTPFSSSRVAYPCRRLWGVAEPIPAARAAAAKVRLSVLRPTGLVAARVGNELRVSAALLPTQKLGWTDACLGHREVWLDMEFSV